jgi:hypothetical protein
LRCELECWASWRRNAVASASTAGSVIIGLASWTAATIICSKQIAMIEVADMDVTEQLIEVVAHIIEQLPNEPLLALLLANHRTNQFSRRMLLPDEIARCRAILEHTHIDWATLGYDAHTLDELVEFLLRIIQSMVIAPPEPPRSSTELRAYLRRWIGPALSAPE